MPRNLYIVRPTLGEGGADRITVTLLEHLPRHLFQPTLVLMRAEGELLAEVPPDVPVLSLDASSLWSAWVPLARLLRKAPPDILFSTSGGTSMIAALAHVLTGRRSRLVLSERNVLRRASTWRRGLQRVVKSRLYPAADCITAVSEGVKAELVRELGLRPETVSVVRNPVVHDELRHLAEEEVDHPWFRDDRPVVLTAGRLVPEKDHATLLAAFARIAEAGDSRLVILGSGPLRSELEARAAELGLSERLWMPGFDSNPYKYMARSTVFVLSSRFEGLPGVLIQAMACGAAVVSTDCPAGPREIVTHERDGLLVPVGDPVSLAGAIEGLLRDRDWRRRLGSEARESSRRFSLEASLPLYTAALLGEIGVGPS